MTDTARPGALDIAGTEGYAPDVTGTDASARFFRPGKVPGTFEDRATPCSTECPDGPGAAN